jgi:hypothetical protein
MCPSLGKTNVNHFSDIENVNRNKRLICLSNVTSFMRIMSLRTLKMSVVISGVMLSLGCGSDTTGPGTKTAAQRYWQLTLNHHAITLATISPYDTIQLIATPRTITGDTLATTARPVFTTSDTSITIDSTGFIRVHGTDTRTNITVIAKLTVGGAAGLTLADTAFVNVVQQTSADLVPMMDSLILRPVAGDSARRATIPDTGFGFGVQLPITQDFDTSIVKDALGNAIPNVAVRFRSADRLIARFVDPTIGTVTAISPGAVLLTAEATVYGKSKTVSLPYIVGWPLQQKLTYGGSLGSKNVSGLSLPAQILTPPNILQSQGSYNFVIGQGGDIIWINHTVGLVDDSMDVQFDDTVGIRGPTVPTTISSLTTVFHFPPFVFTYPPDPSANIPALSTIQQIPFFGFLFFSNSPSNSAIRYFTRSGTYHWRSLRRGLSGTIKVVSNDSMH